jgi:hypothetical protein
MTTVTHVSYVGDGLRRITVDVSGSLSETLWARCKVRKPHVCLRCDTSILVGDVAYRPLLDTDYRMRRICDDCAGFAVPGQPA